jgi:hypothetical protein
MHGGSNTYKKKEEETDVNLVAVSCVLCDVRIYTVTVSYRSLRQCNFKSPYVKDVFIHSTVLIINLVMGYNN